MSAPDLNTLILIVVGALVSWSLRGISSINKLLSQLNNRMAKSETWQEAHGKLDDERHTTTTRNLDSLWDQMNKRE